MTFVYQQPFAEGFRKRGSESEKRVLNNPPIKVACDVKGEEFVGFYMERLLNAGAG